MKNIINLVRRIAKEAETVEDMEKLLISELAAYESFKDRKGDHNITLYDEPRIENNDAVIGDIDGYSIVLHQKLQGDNLYSWYRVRITL